MIRPPQTYVEWSELLIKLREPSEQDQLMLHALDNGSIEWTSGVAEKITNLAYAVIESRLQAATQFFQNEITRAGNQEAAIIRALLNARHRFSFLYHFCGLSPFPAELQDTFKQVVEQYIQDTQTSLIASAKEDRSGRLTQAIKHNSLLAYKTVTQPAAQANAAPMSTGAGAAKRRRVLF